jgi:hypothetical protein
VCPEPRFSAEEDCQLNIMATLLSQPSLKNMFKCVCDIIYSNINSFPNSLLFNCLELLHRACGDISPTQSRELASAFTAMVTWECGCQLPFAANHPLLSNEFHNLVKLTVALAYHNNTKATAETYQLRNSLEVQWLIYAMHWTLTNQNTLKSTTCTQPTHRLHTKENQMATTLNELHGDQPFVEAVLNINFNRLASGDLIQQTLRWYQSTLTVGCSKFALTIVDIVIQDHETVEQNDLLTFTTKIKPYLTYGDLIETNFFGLVIDLEMEDDDNDIHMEQLLPNEKASHDTDTDTVTDIDTDCSCIECCEEVEAEITEYFRDVYRLWFSTVSRI